MGTGSLLAMLTSARSLPAVLWALLLTSAPSAQHETWDNAVCTKGVLSVSRGERAVMACNISNPFSHVAICLVDPGGSCQPIFKKVAPGYHSAGRWQLLVQGGTAQLVTEEAQDSQSGQYHWLLKGHQTAHMYTTLNISAEPQELPFMPSQGPETLPSPPEAVVQSTSQAPILALFLVGTFILGFSGVLFWLRRRRFARRQELLPGSWF